MSAGPRDGFTSRSAQTRIDAAAQNGIWIIETGDLETGAIVGDGGQPISRRPDRSSTPSAVAINVKGPAVNLSAGTGSIGVTGHALRSTRRPSRDHDGLGTDRGEMNRTCRRSRSGTVISATGNNITLATLDTSAVGDAWCLARRRRWWRHRRCHPQCGDDIILPVGGVISAGGVQ